MRPTRRQLLLQRRPAPAPPPRSVQLLDPSLYDAPASYSKLLILATTHAQLIASRWRKKKVALRTKCLTRAWAATVEASSPSLNNVTPRPAEPPSGPIAQTAPKLCHQIFKASHTTASHASPIQKLAVADYLYSTGINLENLAQSPAPLLNLLYTRSTTSPAEIGRWDYINVIEPLLQLFKIAEEGTQDLDDEIMEVVVIGKWATEYGLIKSWSTRSLDLMGGLPGKHVVALQPQGLYLFRWQKVILDFCINCILDILDTEANRVTDFTPPTNKADKKPLGLLIADVGTISQANTQAGLSNSRALRLKMQLYSPPEKFDFRHAYRLAITMLREAQDHVDLLHSDPHYLLDQTSALIEHCAEHIADPRGDKGNPHSVESVQDSVKKLIHNNYARLFIFNEIVLQFEDVNELCIDSHGEANDRLDEAISAIRSLLLIIERVLDTILSVYAFAGRQLRGYFHRVPTTSLSGEMTIMANSDPATVYERNPIAGILMCTTTESRGEWKKDVFKLRRISDEVERELLEHPELKDTIDPWTMGVLGMVASVYELMDALDAYVPCGGIRTEQDLNSTAPVNHAVNAFAKIMPTLKLATFFGGTDNGLEALQRVETLPGSLKRLWEEVDREVAKLSPDGTTLANWVGSSQGRLAKKRKSKWTWQGQVWFAEGAAEDDNTELYQDASRLPELIPIEPFEDAGYGKDTWLVCDALLPDLRENRPPGGEARKPKPRLPTSQNEPLRPFGVNAEGSTGLVPDPEQAPKQKIKTRGTTTEKEDNVDGTPPQLTPTVESHEKILVSNRAHQLLVQLATASAPLAWKDFLYLMTNLGFSVFHGGGSAFRFEPTDLGDESINFHRPHPESELSKMDCRYIWTRLHRNYRWDLEGFGVRQNEQVQEKES